MKLIKYLIPFCLVCLIHCKKEAAVPTNTNTGVFTAESSVFTDNGTLPAKYTCDGQSISPPISWKNVPAGTKSFAVTMHTIPPTGDKHVYIVLYNIPSTINSIAENTSGVGLFGINTVNGKNTYTPPCSQGPGAKLYTLTVYALSSDPIINVIPSKVTMDILLDAIKNTTLSSAVLNVYYTRP